MPTVSDFITNDLTNPPMIPRELQAIIDKVVSRSTMPRSEREAAAKVAGEALSGVAAQGVARRGAMERQRITEAGLGQRLGVVGAQAIGQTKLTGMQAMEQARLKETAATERAGITAKPRLVTATAEAQPISPLFTPRDQGFGIMRPVPPAISPPPAEPLSWWEKNKSIMFDY